MRIWTPLGTNQLKIDNRDGKALPLEVLSRGTREAVFIALRLSLAAAYARRGVMLPLVLDDVLVNFDGDRAVHAAETLRTFAELGHQVMMFTCHEHIVEIFQSIGVEVRQLPTQGKPGRATILLPPAEDEPVEEVYEEVYEEVDEEPELIEETPEPEPEIVEPTPEPVVETIVVETPSPKPPPQPKIKRVYVERREEPEPEEEPIAPQPAIGWAWFEREPADGHISTEERAAETISAAHRAIEEEWFDDQPAGEDIPDEVWDRNNAWWDGSRVVN